MHDNKKYWEQRYLSGGNSGAGSYNDFAKIKADYVNDLINENDIKNVIEFGHGDGNQLQFFNFETYEGYDISPTAVNMCRSKFINDKTKTFNNIIDYKQTDIKDLALSLEVIFHLVEDNDYYDYLEMLDNSKSKLLLIQTMDDGYKRIGGHVRTRQLEDYNFNNYELISVKPAFVKQKFYLYKHK